MTGMTWMRQLMMIISKLFPIYVDYLWRVCDSVCNSQQLNSYPFCTHSKKEAINSRNCRVHVKRSLSQWSATCWTRWSNDKSCGSVFYVRLCPVEFRPSGSDTFRPSLTLHIFLSQQGEIIISTWVMTNRNDFFVIHIFLHVKNK